MSAVHLDSMSLSDESCWAVNLKEVFVSHAHEDKALAGKVKEILQANGVSAFLAHLDMEVSDEWRTEIFRHLETSSALIAIVTRNFAKSAWANQEVGIAFEKKLPLIPLMFDGSAVLKGVIEMYQGIPVSESNLVDVVKSTIPTINKGVPSTERKFYKDLAGVLSRLIIRWQTYKGHGLNVKCTPEAIEEIKKNLRSDREELLDLVSNEAEIDFGVKAQTTAITSQIDVFALFKINFNKPYAETYSEFQELEHKGEQVFYTAQALRGWLQTEKLS
jgi:hypothetical protein